MVERKLTPCSDGRRLQSCLPHEAQATQLRATIRSRSDRVPPRSSSCSTPTCSCTIPRACSASRSTTSTCRCLTLEELDNNKKGMTEVARNARQASRFLDELVTAPAKPARHRQGHPARREVRRRGHRPALPADRDDHHRAAADARERQGRQPDHRRRDAPGSRQHPKRERDPGVQRHQHAHQGARARARRRGLLQRQGARGHRPPLPRHRASCPPTSGTSTARTWSRGSRAATRITGCAAR